jgi:hypothetical protein
MLRSPLPSGVVAASNPGPSSATVKRSAPSSTSAIVTPVAPWACLIVFCSASIQEKYDGRLDGVAVAAEPARADRRGQRRVERHEPQRLCEPVLGQRRRRGAVRERAHHVDGLVDPVADRVELLDAIGHVGTQLLGEEREADAQREQLLLGAVVEVALELAPLVLGDRRDLAARRAQVRDQPRVLEHHEPV